MNETTENYLYSSDIPEVERYIEGILLSIIASVAIFGNASLWTVVVSKKVLRTDSNFLLLSLSLADFLVSIVSMPLTTVTIFMSRWIFSSVTCKALGFINMLTLVASVMSLGLISINRYIKICNPNFYRSTYSVRNILVMTAGVWGLSAVLATPPLIGWGVYDYLPRQSFCFCSWATSVSYTFFMVGTCFFGPLTMMTVCYFKIIRTFRQSSRRVRSQQPPTRHNHKPDTEEASMAQQLKEREEESKLSNETAAKTHAADNDVSKNTNIKGKRFFTFSAKMRQAFSNSNNSSTGKRLGSNDKGFVGEPEVKITVFSVIDQNLDDRGIGYSELQDNNVQSGKRLKENPDMSQTTTITSKTAKLSAAASGLETLQVPAFFPPASSRASNRRRSIDSSTSSAGESSFSHFTSFADTKAILKDQLKVEVRSRRGSQDTLRSAVTQRKKEKQFREEFQLALSLMIVIFAFVLCWFPFCITMFLSVFAPDSLSRPADMFTLMLGYSNSCLNPILYGFLNKNIKEGYRRLIRTIVHPFLCLYAVLKAKRAQIVAIKEAQLH